MGCFEAILHNIFDFILYFGLLEALLDGVVVEVDDGFEFLLIKGCLIQVAEIVVSRARFVLFVGHHLNPLHPVERDLFEIVSGVALRLPVELPQLLHDIL